MKNLTILFADQPGLLFCLIICAFALLYKYKSKNNKPGTGI